MITGLVTDTATKLFVWSFVLHWLCDWILQSDWIAANKVGFVMIPLSKPAKGDWKYLTIPHKAAWVHAGIHLLGLLLIFPWWMALIVAAIHLLIDTRIPLRWWQNFYKQTTTGDIAIHVAIWTDQALHAVTLAIAALIAGGLKW